MHDVERIRYGEQMRENWAQRWVPGEGNMNAWALHNIYKK